MRDEHTIFVWVMPVDKADEKLARFFIVRNTDVAAAATYPPNWYKGGVGFISLPPIREYENNWALLHGNEGRGKP